MKITIRVGLLVFLLNSLISIACADESQVDLGNALVSPDGALISKIDFDNDEYRLSIKNTSTSKFEKIKVIDRFPLAVRWSKDSRSLILIEHLAGGSDAQVIRQNGAKWVTFEAGPLLTTPASYSVVEVNDKGRKMRFTYKIAYEEPNGEVTHFGLYSFILDLRTGNRSDIVTSLIEFEKYKLLSLKFTEENSAK